MKTKDLKFHDGMICSQAAGENKIYRIYTNSLGGANPYLSVEIYFKTEKKFSLYTDGIINFETIEEAKEYCQKLHSSQDFSFLQNESERLKQEIFLKERLEELEADRKLKAKFVEKGITADDFFEMLQLWQKTGSLKVK